MKQTLSDPGIAWQSSENGYLWSLDGPLISRPHQAPGSSPAADVSWQCLSAASGTRAFAGVAPELVAMPWAPAQPARALQAHACAPQLGPLEVAIARERTPTGLWYWQSFKIY